MFRIPYRHHQIRPFVRGGEDAPASVRWYSLFPTFVPMGGSRVSDPASH